MSFVTPVVEHWLEQEIYVYVFMYVSTRAFNMFERKIKLINLINAFEWWFWQL